MKKNRMIMLSLLFIAVLAVSSYTLITLLRPPTESKQIANALQATSQEIHAVQLNPGKNYINELQEVININKNATVREDAVLVLADIAVRKGETNLILDFLKILAYNEKDSQVRSAAYASVDLIRDIYPLELKADLGLHIGGDFRKGGNMTLFVYVNSTQNTEASIAINALQENLSILSPSILVINITSNIPKEVQFKIHISNIGDYSISISLEISYNRLDYETLTKKIFFRIHENYGEITAITDQ
ncbi:MAG: hypothetical protein QG670_2085 [Thermoproteota archaeon]|nr:hypothetical protein [Thermoproteota archaeon]